MLKNIFLGIAATLALTASAAYAASSFPSYHCQERVKLLGKSTDFTANSFFINGIKFSFAGTQSTGAQFTLKSGKIYPFVGATALDGGLMCLYGNSNSSFSMATPTPNKPAISHYGSNWSNYGNAGYSCGLGAAMVLAKYCLFTTNTANKP